MKLKFKADSHDMFIFVLFAIFLLYVVCLGVLNFPELAVEGHFYGFNPIHAFYPENIKATIVLYLFFLGAIFASVSSYFFEMEKGIGVTTQKSDKNYSRWAKEKEIKNDTGMGKVDPLAETSKAGGVPLILKKNEIWVDDGEYHTLVIGATGSGKTQSVIFPTVNCLAKAGESMIITDPKGEIYEKTSNMLREKGYQILLLNFRDPQKGNSWNPMELPYTIYKSGNVDKAIELIDDLALNILYEESSGNSDPFWEKTSADYFAGLTLALFEDAKQEEININSISLMTTVGEEKFGGTTYIKEYFGAKDPSSPASINASGTIMAPNETKGSILSVFRQKIKLFASRENLSEMLSHSDIDLETIGEKKTALFIVIQDEKKTYHSLVTILLKQCYETLISVAQKHGGKLPVRTNFLLDEFANMPPLKDVTTMITAARSRAIRFTMIIQNFSQLDQVYTKEVAETIKGNCGNIIYLITTELKALEEISKMCGEVKSKKDEKTSSTPLVTVSDLQRMKQYETIILRMRMQPFKTKMTPNFQMNWGKEYPKASYPEREKQKVHIFDLKEYVKAEKKAKLYEMMGEQSGGMMGGGIGPGMESGLFGGMGNRPMPDFSRENINPTNTTPLREPLNVDDLVKKIDAKIAEIEAEEKAREEAEKKIENDKKVEASEVSTLVEKVVSPIENKVVEESSKEITLPLEIEPEIKKEEVIIPTPELKEEIIVPQKEIIEEEKPKVDMSMLLSTDKKVEEKSEAKNNLVEDKKIIYEKEIPVKEISVTDDQFFDDFFED
ncbi:MAG: type IV secretory system conjugative DNA transfer family protein [Bacilli bacterium]|nr:type IV secretory system conjugative DNA transfer family protein [Bacilli bacterium]